MYPNEQSISSYSSNPSTPVNSPPPLTQAPSTTLSLHNSTPSTSWQQLTPANVVLNNSPAPVLNGIQNGQYAPELVHRGLHMVINSFLGPLLSLFSSTRCCTLRRTIHPISCMSLTLFLKPWFFNNSFSFLHFVSFSVVLFSKSLLLFATPKTNQPELLDEAFGMLRNAENATVSRRLCVFRFEHNLLIWRLTFSRLPVLYVPLHAMFKTC